MGEVPREYRGMDHINITIFAKHNIKDASHLMDNY